MIRFNRRIRYGIWTLVAFLLASCSKPEEEEDDEYLLSYGKVDVTVSVTLPRVKVVEASTRLIQAGGVSYSTDTDIRNMDMLIFDKDAKFMKRVKVELNQLKVTETGVSFTVRLDATKKKRIIHLVANAHEKIYWAGDRLNFDTLSVGMSEQDAISSLRTTEILSIDMDSEPISNGGGIGPLIMWGRFVLENGTNVSEPVTGVKLLRATATIQVKKGDAVGADNGLDDFILDRFCLHNAYAQGFLAPADCTGTVSIPITANPFYGAKIFYNLNALAMRLPTLSREDPVTGHIYERNCTPDDYMSILIGAAYKGVFGYYKVVMTDRDGTPLNIIRSHRYIVTIVGVNGPGVDYAADAAALPLGAGQLKVEVTNEDTVF